jgi:hypothetical protein
MSAAIVTRYHGPTNTKGARISARTLAARPVFVPCSMIALGVFLILILLAIVFDL